MHSLVKNKVSRVIDARNDIVRLDMAFGIAPIVRPLSDESKRRAINITRNYRGSEIHYVGNELSTFDLSILIALLSLAQKLRPEITTGDSVNESSGDALNTLTSMLPIKKGFKPDGANIAQISPAVSFETSYNAIRKEMGSRGRSSEKNDAIMSSLLRLQSLTVAIRNADGKWASTHLILPMTGQNESLKIALSFRLVNSLFNDGDYSRIDMNVFRALPKQGVARILYVHTLSWMTSRKSAVVNITTLIDNTFGVESCQLKKTELADKKFKIKAGLKAIEALNAFKFETNADVVTVIATLPMPIKTSPASPPQLNEQPIASLSQFQSVPTAIGGMSFSYNFQQVSWISGGAKILF